MRRISADLVLDVARLTSVSLFKIGEIFGSDLESVIFARDHARRRMATISSYLAFVRELRAEILQRARN